MICQHAPCPPHGSFNVFPRSTHLAVECPTDLKERGFVPQRLIQFSDGCACQYKSKTPFMDLSYGIQDMGISRVERHYFGSSHGKNPCDGEGGIVKNSAARAVQCEPDVTINNAESFFTFCTQRLSKEEVNEEGKCSHSRRTFFFIRKGEINRNRPSRTNVYALPGTRQIHSAVCIEPKKLGVRRLSCFCEGCNSLVGQCANRSFVDEWTTKELKTKPYLHDKDQVSEGHVHSADGDCVDDAVTLEAADVGLENLSGETEMVTSDESATEDESDLVLNSESPSGFSPVTVRVEVEEYYAVYYDKEYYVGRVLEAEGDFYKFKFMHRVRSSVVQEYDWPKRADIATVSGIYIIHGPLQLLGSGPFRVVNLEIVDSLYKSMKSRKM
ncbi:hypothetical protein HOLleu_06447 [Holothuria leucospilota]|uniref:Uncharacterized protein n=1 Tax=Holothuria leucospilota TaxID=206669 RepID=A0A9Q1CML1_HOLLE|nr:hypothetical protein HOLleu_06447 [Holothuria leucospilota]